MSASFSWSVVCALVPLTVGAQLRPPEKTASPSVITRSDAQGQRTAFRPYGKVHVFPVGVNHYPALVGYQQLGMAEADATAVAQSLRERFSYEVREPLLGAKATRAAILLALEQYQQKLGEDDVLVFFFAGHGDSAGPENSLRGFLLPVDARLDSRQKGDITVWKREALDMQELAAMSSKMKCRHVLMIIDACYSGFFGARSGSSGRFDLDQLLSGKSRLVLTAGTRNQRALEGGARPDGTPFKNSVFTTALVEGLKENDAFSARELALSVRKSVLTWSRGAMQPLLREIAPELYGEFVFIPTGSAKSSEFQLERLLAWFRSRGAESTSLVDIYETITAENYRYSTRRQALEADWQTRLKRFEENAALGSPLAMSGLSIAYRRGLGAEKNASQAYHWALESFYSGRDAAGLYALAKCYSEGFGVERNVAQAVSLLEEAASQGFAPAIEEMAAETLKKRGRTSEEVRSAITELSKALDFPLAAWKLSSVYNGTHPGVPRNVQRSIELLEPAAAKGLMRAVADLGIAYSGVMDPKIKDIEKARRLFIEAAESGNRVAQYTLGVIYKTSSPDLGLPKDPVRARNWFHLAAEQGNIWANLILYDEQRTGGSGVVNYAEARKYLERALEDKSSAEAIAKAAQAYEEGRVYPRDISKAVALHLAAAAMGNADAERRIGSLYISCSDEWNRKVLQQDDNLRTGCFVLPHVRNNNELRALYWLSLAVEHKSQSAVQLGRDILYDRYERDPSGPELDKLLAEVAGLYPKAKLPTTEEFKRLFRLP